MKFVGHHIISDILTGQNMHHLPAEMTILGPKNNKYPFP